MMGREKGKRIGPIQKSEKENGPGAWCYKARLDAGLTIAELAKKSRVSVRTIMRIEAGHQLYRLTSSSRYVKRALGLIP